MISTHEDKDFENYKYRFLAEPSDSSDVLRYFTNRYGYFLDTDQFEPALSVHAFYFQSDEDATYLRLKYRQ